MKKWLKVALLCAALPTTTMLYAQVIQNFQPTFPKFPLSAQERKKTNLMIPLGQATFNNNVKLPMYGVSVADPYDEGILADFQKCSANVCRFDFKLDPAHAAKLKLLALADGSMLLVPRDWANIGSALGANGTAITTLIDRTGKEAISLYDSAACLGCGLPAASLYFPHLLAESLDNEYGGMRDPKKYLSLVHPSKKVAFFSYQIPNLAAQTHGVAKYEDGDFNFKVISITLNQANAALARPMLNFYNKMH